MSEPTIKRLEIVSQGGMRFEARNPDGIATVMDSAPAGESAGLSPMELLLAGLGGCTAMDVISILRKKRLEVTDYQLDVCGVRASEHPKVYTKMTVHHIVTGKDIPEAAVRQAVELSQEKYCSVSAMLRKAADISTTFEVRDLDPADEISRRPAEQVMR